MSNDHSSSTPQNTLAIYEQSRSPSNNNSINPLFYPKPEAEFHQIAQNPELFLQKLHSFHASFGSTKLKIPKVGGKLLDVHHLFLEVTSRGGIEKVITDRRWKEVTGTFDFPSSITSKSFVLRKYYLSLLYHFEQVYYLRKEAPSALHSDSTRELNWLAAPNPEDGAMIIHNSGELEEGFVTGTIDAKFDHGYLITVNLGSEKLKGVLYHTPTNKTSTSSAPKKKKKKQLIDPSRPKRCSSGYNFFFAEHYYRLKPSYEGEEKLITKHIAALWNKLSDGEKQVYNDRGLQDRERYKAEMEIYNLTHP